MMIRGVRSVGIDDEEAHVIKFLNPLTIINGPNGTGKTVILCFYRNIGVLDYYRMLKLRYFCIFASWKASYVYSQSEGLFILLF